MKTCTTTEAAELLGCTTRTITRHCAANKIGEKVEIIIKTEELRLSKADVEHLRTLVKKRGNPNFGKS